MHTAKLVGAGQRWGSAQIRAEGAISSGDMALINKLARSPLKAEDVFVFAMVPTTDALDSYFTRQAQSSLQNYAAELAAGVAIMNSHRTAPHLGGIELPIGRTFAGSLQRNGGVTEVAGRGYLLRNYQPNSATVNTDTIIRGIEAGIVADLSIGFTPGQYICSLCGMDMMSQQCAHYPGRRYDGLQAYAWIEGGHLQEVSLVYSGATPGAQIRSARRGRPTPAGIRSGALPPTYRTERLHRYDDGFHPAAVSRSMYRG